MPTFQEAVNEIKSKLSPQNLDQIKGVFAFHFKDTGGEATLDARDAKARGWLEGSPEQHDLTPNFEVTINSEDFARLVFGQLNPMAGMVSGRMQLKGSIKEAIKLDRLLKA